MRRRNAKTEPREKSASSAFAEAEETSTRTKDANDVSLEVMAQKMRKRASTIGAPFHQLRSSILVDSRWEEITHDIEPTASPAAARRRAMLLRSNQLSATQQRESIRLSSTAVRRESIRPLQDFSLQYHAKIVSTESFSLLSFLFHGTPRWIAKLVRLLCFVVALLPAFCVFFCHYFFLSDRIALPYVTDKEKRTSRHYLDIYGGTTTCLGQERNETTTTPTVDDQLKPVLVFFTGGAWIIGYKMWGTLMARALVPFGIMVVIPDYRNFPQTNVNGMIEDADWAVDWTLKNIHKYGGNPNKVVIAGQSAGAHIGACLLLRKAKMEAPPTALETDVSDNATTASWHALDVNGFIAVSGPYDLVEMSDIFHQHGLDRSIVSAIFCNDVARHSPTVMICELFPPPNQPPRHGKTMKDDLGTVVERVQMHLPPTCIIHGQMDKTVPFKISLEFFEALKRLKMQQPLEFKLYPSWGHTDPILEAPFAGNHLFHRDVYELVRVWTAASQPGFGEDDSMRKDMGEQLLPFDESHPACGKICPLFLVQVARFCNPF